MSGSLVNTRPPLTRLPDYQTTRHQFTRYKIVDYARVKYNTNFDGGCVLIGVEDKGKVKGVLIGKETVKQIADSR